MIVNSLAGEYLNKSVELLAPFGRFVELGKIDIIANSKLNILSTPSWVQQQQQQQE